MEEWLKRREISFFCRDDRSISVRRRAACFQEDRTTRLCGLFLGAISICRHGSRSVRRFIGERRPLPRRLTVISRSLPSHRPPGARSLLLLSALGIFFCLLVASLLLCAEESCGSSTSSRNAFLFLSVSPGVVSLLRKPRKMSGLLGILFRFPSAWEMDSGLISCILVFTAYSKLATARSDGDTNDPGLNILPHTRGQLYVLEEVDLSLQEPLDICGVYRR